MHSSVEKKYGEQNDRCGNVQNDRDCSASVVLGPIGREGIRVDVFASACRRSDADRDGCRVRRITGYLGDGRRRSAERARAKSPGAEPVDAESTPDLRRGGGGDRYDA